MIGKYFADFACHRLKLLIEVGGSGHGAATQVSADAERTAYLNSHGCRVLRFWNNEVPRQIDGVMTDIYDACMMWPAPHPHPHPHP